MHDTPRFVGPTLSSSLLDDKTYSRYSLAYVDYLDRVRTIRTTRTYITPPTFPQSGVITDKSVRLHRRLFAMYGDVVNQTAPSPAVPGYCYMKLLDPSHAGSVALNLGPYPTVKELMTSVHLSEPQYRRMNLVLQADGSFHVTDVADGFPFRDICDARNLGLPLPDSFDLGTRVGGMIEAVRAYNTRFNGPLSPLPVVHTTGPHHSIVHTVDYQAVFGTNYAIPDELLPSGRWAAHCRLAPEMVIPLLPGSYLGYQHMLIGSESDTVYFRTEHEVDVEVLTSVSVTAEEIRSYIGKADWRSGISEHFINKRTHVKFDVFRDRTVVPVFLNPSSAVAGFVATASCAITGRASLRWTGDGTIPKRVSITDQHDNFASVFVSRYEAVAGGPTRMRARASVTSPSIVHALRNSEHWNSNKHAISISGCVFIYECDRKVACLADYYVEGNFPDGVSHTYRVASPGNDEQFESDFGAEGSGYGGSCYGDDYPVFD